MSEENDFKPTIDWIVETIIDFDTPIIFIKDGYDTELGIRVIGHLVKKMAKILKCSDKINYRTHRGDTRNLMSQIEDIYNGNIIFNVISSDGYAQHIRISTTVRNMMDEKNQTRFFFVRNAIDVKPDLLSAFLLMVRYKTKASSAIEIGMDSATIEVFAKTFNHSVVSFTNPVLVRKQIDRFVPTFNEFFSNLLGFQINGYELELQLL